MNNKPFYRLFTIAKGLGYVDDMTIIFITFNIWNYVSEINNKPYIDSLL